MASYSMEQRQAIARAVLDEGLGAQEAVDRAHAGTLDGFGPFDVTLARAREWATKERQRRTKQTVIRREREQSGAGVAVCEQALQIIRGEFDVLWEQRDDPDFDHVRFRRACKDAREAFRLIAAARSVIPPDQMRQNGRNGNEPSPLLEQLSHSSSGK